MHERKMSKFENIVITLITLIMITLIVIGVYFITTDMGNRLIPRKNTTESSVGESISDSFSVLTKSEVVRVKDGDTYVLKINGEETTVRLIGVDNPESVAPADYSKENTSEGKAISEIVKQKIQSGDILCVEYDVSKTDKYGRTLAYLYFENGLMVQEWLLENGYARVMTVQPNSKYSERFAEIQHQAAENKVGLWNGFFESE